MIKKTLILLSLLVANTLVAFDQSKLPDGIYANIMTNKGNILVSLAYEKAPLTVINFVGLASGSKSNSIMNNKPYYDGLKFHRVIDNFMIQGGDPRGNGTGGPGYSFFDEITDLKHDRAGILSMANAGPNTNGSQFFITHLSTPHLDGKHTVFGSVVSGLDVVSSIKQGDIIKHIKIYKIGAKAQAFKTDDTSFYYQFDKYSKKQEFDAMADKSLFAQFVKSRYPNATNTTDSGMYYYYINRGSGKKIVKADTVSLHYSFKLANGKELVNSRKKNKPLLVKQGVGELVVFFDEALAAMRVGDRKISVVPYNLTKYVVGLPPKTVLILDIEPLKIN